MQEKDTYVSAKVEVIDAGMLDEISAFAGTCQKGTSTGGQNTSCSNRRK